METAQLGHGLTRMVRTGESKIEMTKDAVDSYLCKNGYPIENGGRVYMEVIMMSINNLRIVMNAFIILFVLLIKLN